MFALVHYFRHGRDRFFGEQDFIKVLAEMGGGVPFIPKRSFDHPTERFAGPLAVASNS